jgi:hypothetical protein
MANPENKFVDVEDYKSMITPQLRIVGTENKEQFAKEFLNDDVRKQYKLIGTHSDCFHCDEVLATSILLRTD